MPRNIRALDLNLLAVFDAVLRERSVTRAAESLGLTQPTVSNALRRLREHFADPLFVRTAHGVLPTPAAEEIGRGVSAALEALDASLREPRRFAPDRASREFTIIMTDVGEVVFLPRLLDHLRKHAPSVRLRTVQRPAALTPRALEAGEVDLAIGFQPDLVSGVYQQRLFGTEYVCIARRSHPGFDDRRSGRKAFLDARHVIAEAEGTGHYVVEQEFARLGLRERIALRVPHFLAVPHIVAAGDLLATVPRPLAEVFERLAPIRLLEHPLRLPRLEIRQFWHERYHADAANRWLRGAVQSLFAERGEVIPGERGGARSAP